MKTILSLLASCALAPYIAVLAQTTSQTDLGSSAELLAQNGNQEVQTGTSSAGNNRNTQTAVVQQNRQSTTGGLAGGSGGGGIGGFGGGYSQRLQNVISRYPGAGEPPLVVRSSDMDPKDAANLEEDLAVMAHILDKALEDFPSGQVHARSAMGINVFVSPNSGTIRSIYLDGFGALFLLDVSFPLVAPASAAPEEKPSGDSAWAEARHELYGQSEPQTVTTAGEEFSEEKVTRLKEALLRALKNATNIRGLEGDITVCVLGGANSITAKNATTLRRMGTASGAEVDQLLVAGSEALPLQGTVLTIKVSKADVDAFAKGELKFADFQERTHIVAYRTAAAHSTALYGGGAALR